MQNDYSLTVDRLRNSKARGRKQKPFLQRRLARVKSFAQKHENSGVTKLGFDRSLAALATRNQLMAMAK